MILMINILLVVLVCLNQRVDSNESGLYDFAGDAKYDCELLHRGDIRYLDFLKKLRRYESRVKGQGMTIERYPIPMFTNDRHYECSIPYSLPQYISEGITNQPVDDSMEVPPFLESLLETCIYRWEGWWTYEFCYGKHVRQFHQEQDGSIPSQYLLGQDVGTTSGAPADDFYSEEYESGSFCDVTGKGRTCELRFHCAPHSEVSVIYSLSEPSSCNYVMRIDTPLLCKHPKYKSKLESETEKILCFETPVPTEEEVLEEELKIKKQKLQKPDLQSKIEKPLKTEQQQKTETTPKPETKVEQKKTQPQQKVVEL